MIYEKIRVSNICRYLKDSKATINAYILENSDEININKKRSTIIICPGGGYGFTSDRESEPVALKFIAKGYNAIVIRYSVAPIRYPNALLELASTINYVRNMEYEWNVDKDKVILCGFSAGGHLVGSLGVLWNDKLIKQELNINNDLIKPNGMILCYPVITSGEFSHIGSFDNLFGKMESKNIKDKLSLERLVSKDTPKTFLWHTFNDNTVPVQNSLLFANALVASNIPIEMHIYPAGIHGLSLCEEVSAKIGRDDQIDSHVASWFELACEWIDRL